MKWTRVAPGAVACALLLASCGRAGRRVAPVPAVPAIPVTVPDSAAAKPDSGATPAATPAAAVDSAARVAKKPDRPGERCDLDFENTPETRFLAVKDPISQKYTSYVGGGVVGVCSTRALRITADSAEQYDQNQLTFLIGHVKYREDRVALDADKVTYFQAEERILAEGNVVVTMKDSSSMVGPRAEYWRAVRGIRNTSRINATARPTLKMYETDSLGRRQKDPVTLIANDIVGEGESLFVAHGDVQLDRTDLKARGDSAVLDNLQQFSRLMKNPFVESKGSQPFTLSGQVIDVFGRTRRVDRILAVDSARAVNKDLTLTATRIDMRVNDNKLQRAYAFGGGNAVAITRERKIIADSLDVRMPNQRIRELRAVRRAYAESDPDTAKVRTKERDWLRGNTIVARFDSTQTDTAAQPRVIDLVADGTASSFYQVPANNGDKERPGVNYVRGRKITVDFKEKDVNSVTVTDSVSGVYLEAAPPDTLPKNGKKPAARRPSRTTPTQPRRPGVPHD